MLFCHSGFTLKNNPFYFYDAIPTPTTNWVHIALVRSGTSATLYVDGVVTRNKNDMPSGNI